MNDGTWMAGILATVGIAKDVAGVVRQKWRLAWRRGSRPW